MDHAPPAHVLQLVWGRIPEDAEREAAELLDVDPAPLDPLPSTVKVICVPDPAVLSDADLRRLHVGAFGKDHAWRHLKPLIWAALLHPPPMQAAVRGSRVEFLADLLTEVVPLAMRAIGKPGAYTSGRGLSRAPPASTPRTCCGTSSHRRAAGPPRRCGRPSPRTKSSCRCSWG